MGERKRRIAILSSSKALYAAKYINEFLDGLGEEAENVKITPMLSYNGPSLWIGAMIDYHEEVQDEQGPTKE